MVNLFYLSLRMWNISKAHDEYLVLLEFLEIMSNITLDRFHELYEYESNERLKHVNLRDLVEYVCKV